MAVISSDILVSTIQNEIQRVQDDLIGVEENLKRLTGRDFNEPRGERRIRLSSGGREDEPPPKRRPPGGVFARLGEPVSEPTRGRRVHEVLEEGEIPRQKPSVASSVARPTVDGKSRTEAAAELTKDRASRDRNRRMFGALLGTLQRFRTEEAKQKGKDEQRAKIEKKLEEKGRAEKEELRKERIELLTQRKERQLRIKRLSFKIERVKEHEAWEANQRRLGNFIRTRTKPRIFWVPKILQPRTSQLITNTRNSIERELEEARLRLKDELDEALGGRVNLPLREEHDEEEAEREEMRNNLDYKNGSDLLDYDAEEGELVYEDELLLSGKKQKGKGERVVVQVESNVSRAPQRRVELVTVVAERNKRNIEGEGNESEKENMIRSRINSENRKNGDSLAEKVKGRVRDREKDKERKNLEKEEKNKPKEKSTDKKSSKSHSHKESPTKKKELRAIKKEKKNGVNTHKSKDDSRNQAAEMIDDFESVNFALIPELELSANIEDLSQINLPMDPEPMLTQNITEVVVQHVPVDSTVNGDDFNSEMQVETVLLDTSHIKEDKTVWDEEILKRSIMIKKEKDATPEKTSEELVEKSRKVGSTEGKGKGAGSSSDSSSDSEESSSESEEDSSASNTSGDSSDSSSSSDEDKKNKKKEKEKITNRKKKDHSSSSSSSSSEDESDSSSSSSDEDKAKKDSVKKSSGGRKSSPKHIRKGEKDRPTERKKVEKKESKSRGRKGSRSRSRDKKRERSRSKDRRRGRR